jgi:glycerol-3-phosphate cytidylyltransferase-like family protein
MPAPLPRYALVSFTHYDDHVVKGHEYDLHHPMVELRPDLFTTEPPETKSKKEAV